MKVLVTGAAGFIGFHTCRALLARGAGEVVGLDNLNDYYPPQLKRDRLAQLAGEARFRFEHLDLADAAGVMRVMAALRPDYVVHLGAQAGVRYSVERPDIYVASNLTGTLSVLEACRHHPVRHLVFSSSSSVYGANTKVPFAEADRTDRPVSFYAATKKANEAMAHCYAHLFALPATGLRFFTVYGPWGRPDMSPMLFATAICAGRPIDVFHHGRARRDFTYIDDIVEGVVRTMLAPPAPGAGTVGGERTAAPFRLFNLGNQQPVELMTYIGLLEKHLGRKAVIRLQPAPLGDVEATWADTGALAAAVGFAPATPLDEGLRRFAAWFRDYHRIT